MTGRLDPRGAPSTTVAPAEARFGRSPSSASDPLDERPAAAHAITDRTIAAHGFFEWDSGPEPVRPSEA